MDWVPEFVDGNVRASCSICGCSRRAPRDLTLCTDKRWRCERCLETSEQDWNRTLAEWRKRKPQPDTGFGLSPWDEAPVTFLAAAQARRAQLIPGWTPTTTFQDTFDILPGGGGSPWGISVTTTGTVVLSSAGVATFASGTSATGAVVALANGTAVPAPGAGRFYCACSFRTPIVANNTAIFSVGVADSGGGSRNVVGLRGAGATPGIAYYQLVAQSIGQALSAVDVDATNFHLAELWWKTGSPVFGSIDGGPYLVVASAGAAARVPAIEIINGGGSATSSLDVTDYVCFT